MKNKILKGEGEGIAKRGFKSEEIQSKELKNHTQKIKELGIFRRWLQQKISFGLEILFTHVNKENNLRNESKDLLKKELTDMDFDQDVMEQLYKGRDMTRLGNSQVGASTPFKGVKNACHGKYQESAYHR